MLKSGLALSALVLSLGTAAALADAIDEEDVAVCEIRAIQTPIGMRIESVVRGEPGVSGEYEFALSRSGRGGNSGVSQGGSYTIPDSGEVVVAVNEFNLGRRDKFDAELTVEGPGGAMSCSQSEAD